MSNLKRQQNSARGYLYLLRCPATGQPVTRDGNDLTDILGTHRYPLSASGIPQFALEFSTGDAAIQREHYDTIAQAYVTNLGYPHTKEYLRYLDNAILDVIEPGNLGAAAEICCGRGEAFKLIGNRIDVGIGVDISPAMLEEATKLHSPNRNLHFVQGDATNLPLNDGQFDNVFMFGGIHHVNDRASLFAEIARILKPGGKFYYREPVSDFFVWRMLRALIYRLSPTLDHQTERPLLYKETVPILEQSGLESTHWSTHGFLGFCIFMNSDVLVFNRLFRLVPGITAITRFSAKIDKFILKLPGLNRAGLQVVGVAANKGNQ
ncbi:MAG: class I SAM-dependent methyltransferase [Hyphomicrobiales bacterium]|nr:class I SAM-dependent methyltransferase [Hyphomicrobiales bacterium]